MNIGRLSIIQQQALAPLLGSAWLAPAVSPPHAVACWFTDVAITEDGCDHCSKASNSFSSGEIRAEQREKQPLCLEHTGPRVKREAEKPSFIIS